MKKKMLTLLLIVVVILLACIIVYNTAKEDSPPGVLTDANWSYIDGCDYHISFDEDGSFDAGCGCGDPYMDSDIYAKYRYDKDKGEITTYTTGKTGNTYKIIKCDEYQLILEKKDGNRETYYNLKNVDSVLKSGDWYRKTDAGEEHIVFGEDGSFLYTGANGEALWNSDVYNTYKYYETGFFTTYDKGERGESVDVCKYSKEEISLLDGESDEPIVFVNRK